MKKIAIISLCLLLLGVSIAAAAPQIRHQTATLATDGTFDGSVGYRRGGNTTVVGTISGTYELRNRGGRFTGEWNTDNKTGTFRGGFGRHILIGKISTMVNGTMKSLPIVGFIKTNESQFLGRFMAPVGPALYFWGTYT